MEIALELLVKMVQEKSYLLKIIGNILLADEAYFSFDKNKAQTSYISGNERSFFWRLTVRENF